MCVWGEGGYDVQLIHYLTTIISNRNSISLITYRSYVNYITVVYCQMPLLHIQLDLYRHTFLAYLKRMSFSF